MPSIRQSIRSSTASKRPTSAIADGQIALNTASGTPGMFFKDSAGNIIKAGPAHYGASAPNSSPGVGGSTGNSIGEAWLDSSLTPAGWKIWNGSAFVNATPLSSDTVQGLVELATNAETQAGVDTARAVTSASLQSKVSDSISTASASGIASSAAVKTAYDLANAALPKSGGIITGNLEIGSTGSFTFEGSTADGFETTLAVVDPTLDRTITFPNITGTVVTTGDTGTVTSTMILDGTIVDADINASAEIAVSKLADGAARQLLQTDAAGTGVEWASNIDIPGTLDVTSAATFDSTVAVTGALTKSGNNVVTVGDTGTVTSTMILDGTILNADVNASAAIAGTKISPDFGAQTIVTTGVHSAAAGSAAAPSMTFTGDLNTGIYSPGADQLAISTNGTGRLFVDASGNLGIGNSNQTSYNGSADNLVIGSTGSNGITIVSSSANAGYILFADGTTGQQAYEGQITYDHASNYFGFNTSAAERLRITSTGALNFVGAGTAGSTQAVSFNGSAPVNSLVIDSSGRLGIGNSSPGAKLDVSGDVIFNGGGTQFPIQFANAFTPNAQRADLFFSANATSNNALRVGTIASNGGVTLQGTRQSDSSQKVNLVLNPDGGSVGIGTTDFGGKLTVQTSTSNGAPVNWDSGQLVVTTGTGTASLGIALSVSSTANSASITSLTPGASWNPIHYRASSHIFYKDDASTNEVARLDTSGRLLVGTSSGRSVYGSNARLQVEGTDYPTSALNLIANSNTNSGTAPYLHFARSRGTTVGSSTIVQSGDRVGGVAWLGANGSNLDVPAALIEGWIDTGTPSATSMPGRLTFSTTSDSASSPTERLRITSGGQVLIGRTSVVSGYNSTLSLDYTTGTQYGFTLRNTAASTFGAIVFVNSSDTLVGEISVSTTATTYATSSDYRLKENVVPLSGAIDRVNDLQVHRFNFIANPDTVVDGFIAHEAQAVVPECVTGEKDAVDDDGNPIYQGIDQSKLVPLLTAALQEAITEINALKDRVAALEGA